MDLLALIGGVALAPATVAAGAVLLGSGWRRRRPMAVTLGTALVAAVLGFFAPLVAFVQGWLAAAVLEAVLIGGLLVYAHARASRSPLQTLTGSIIAAVALVAALGPLLEAFVGFPGEFESVMVSIAVGWAAAGSALFVLGIERLRLHPWHGWIPHAPRPAAGISAAIGFAVLALAPAFSALLSNIGS